MIKIIQEEKYEGPSILELASNIPDITDDTIDIRWANSKDEIAALGQYNRNFVLHVADSHIRDRTFATFGKRLRIPLNVLERAKFVLADKKGYDWRNFAGELKDTSPRYLLLKLAADAIRKGIQPSLAEIAGKVLSDGIEPIDADVLMRLRSARMRG